MNEKVLDLNEFLERVQDDKELLLELLDIFLEDYQLKRDLLQKAIDNKDFDEVRNLGHSLKGASGNISAKGLREVLMQIEEMGKNGNIDGIDELVKAMDSNFSELEVEIGNLKKEYSE